MPSFEYTAFKDGEWKRGRIDGESKRKVELILKLRGFTRIKLRKLRNEKRKSLFKGIKSKDVMVFARQLHAFLKSGLPLIPSLEALQVQEKNGQLKEIIQDIRRGVETGSTFSDALSKHQNVFGRFFVSLVGAGEEGGFMEKALEKLYQHMEKVESIRSKVKSALMYPAVVVVVAFLVVSLLLVYVIPVFEKLFASFGGKLPLPTLVVIKLSHMAKAFLPWFIAAAFVGYLILKHLYRKGTIRPQMDSLLLKIPIFGDVVTKAITSRTFYVLSTLLESGIPLLRSLEVASSTSGNYVFEKILEEAKESASKGKSISSLFLEKKTIPYMASKMVEVGEQTGSLSTMLGKAAEYLEEEVDSFVRNISSVIEPILIVFLGVVIGGIVISMYLPIFKLAGAIR